MSELSEKIRERAYQIWDEQGQPNGHEIAHWDQAQQEIEDANRHRAEDDGEKDRRLETGLDETFPSSDPTSESQPGSGITGPGNMGS